MDHHHNMGKSCTMCHPHDDGFQATGGCTECHAEPQGERRRIVGTGGDFELASHHVGTEVQDSDCSACHYVGDHGSGTVKLLDPDLGQSQVHAFDPLDPTTINPLCAGCHDEDGSAAADTPLQPFTDGLTPPPVAAGDTWASSAHQGASKGCFGDGSGTGCHANAHGSPAERLLPLDAGQPIEALCTGCHNTDSHVSGKTFTVGANTYALSCTTCHNPHVVSGGLADTAAGATPLTQPALGADPTTNPRAMGTTPWGDEPGEKMDDYAAAGTYRTPTGDSLSGAELPDYVTFCLACHGPMQGELGGVNWIGDAHGHHSANVPNGGGAIPDWYSAGKATGWDGDECVGTQEECWPPMTRGKGEQIWTRKPYNQEERIAGANFVLSCGDCHQAHGPGIGSKLRETVNGGPGTVIWNTMCNNCHYYYSDWHAGMSCGTASCHVSNSIHGMGAATGSTATRIFDPELVADMRFDKNLNDSGTWRMHARFYDTAGSWVGGKSGWAVSLDGDQPIELGTRNEYWSTDEGRHGTWKYTEMKYHGSLEAWVMPTAVPGSGDTIGVIFTKYSDGGYELHVRDIDNAIRLAFWVNVNGGGEAGIWDDDCNGWRGAFSAVDLPLGQWSHVAGTYDYTLPDGDPQGGTVGRVRVYVNGEDVTQSHPAAVDECYSQPAAGEDTIFPHSDHNFIDPTRCYAGHWCASPMAIGGRMWSSGGRRGFVGRIDAARVWNITKPADYFDALVAPSITHVTGEAGSAELAVVFSEGVFSESDGMGAIGPDDLVLKDTGANNPRTIMGVTHAAGATVALVTMSQPLVADDLGADTLAFAAGQAFDDQALTAETGARLILGLPCPSGDYGSGVPTVFELNEPAGSALVTDTSGTLVGSVVGVDALPGDGTFFGDGVDNGIYFEDSPTCLAATTSLELEARFTPSLVDSGEKSTIQRVFVKGGNNYQMSVWRNTSDTWSPTFSPPR